MEEKLQWRGTGRVEKQIKIKLADIIWHRDYTNSVENGATQAITWQAKRDTKRKAAQQCN